jgi:hypothetical protein
MGGRWFVLELVPEFGPGLAPGFDAGFVDGLVAEPIPGFDEGSVPGPGSALGGGGMGAAELLVGNWTLPGPSGGAASPGRRSDGAAAGLSSAPLWF